MSSDSASCNNNIPNELTQMGSDEHRVHATTTYPMNSHKWGLYRVNANLTHTSANKNIKT